VRYEWNDAKSETNKAKHGVSFELAKLVFDDPFHVAFVERVIDGEERWQAIGTVNQVIVLLVVHTYREQDGEEIVRIISARRASAHERKLYAQALR
jgi:uncharacterized DUF497 family protein